MTNDRQSSHGHDHGHDHDHDTEYRFGRPHVYLTPRQLARLTILRSRLGDTRVEREAAAAGRTRSGARS